jgi:hypothetical protein
VLERQMDDPVGVVRRLGQALGVVDVSPVDGYPGPLQLPGRFIGPGQADHLVARSEQLGNDG